MTLRAEIRGVLSAGPRNAEQIAELCGCTTKQAAQNLSALKAEGKIKIAGTIEGRNSYAIASWPEKVKKDAPPPKAGRRGKRDKKRPRARPAAIPAAPAPNGNSTDQFSITDSGVLGIKQGDVAIQILPDSFARLRQFVERAAEIYNPATE